MSAAKVEHKNTEMPILDAIVQILNNKNSQENSAKDYKKLGEEQGGFGFVSTGHPHPDKIIVVTSKDKIISVHDYANFDQVHWTKITCSLEDLDIEIRTLQNDSKIYKDIPDMREYIKKIWNRNF